MESKVTRKSGRAQVARYVVTATATSLALGALGVGCLNRPVKAGEPVTKTNFTAAVNQTAIDKVDVLLAIDNSASMGDKQDLLQRAVPDLITRLVTPNCVDATGANKGPSDADGKCPTGSKAEFQPVHDLHIGIVSSSLGGAGSENCLPTGNPRQDDQGHLINFGATGAPVGDADPSNFLAYFPTVAANESHAKPAKPITDPTVFTNDFRDIVTGVRERGCGFEAQLESWYRFLVQPDPYATLGKDANGRVILQGTDATILKQRHDFLRPDSLVAIIMLTDENDSNVDPLAVSGQAFNYESGSFPAPQGVDNGGHAARGSDVCASNPNDPTCTSCGFQPLPAGCSTNDPAKNFLDGTTDQLNVRFFHMKQRFGIDPQFPISRYVTGLSETKVPNRDSEHPGGSANYVGTGGTCTNPLFAAELPADASGDVCNLTPGGRAKDLVFFAVIGGVPWQLLLEDPTKPDTSAFKTTVTDNDWASIIGKDPINYDFSGAEPHMVESIVPRSGLVQPGAGVADTADPYNGHEWDTQNADLQYACTFPLPTAKDCTKPEFAGACDCEQTRTTNPPLCSGSATSTMQTRGKAYPTIREFAVVRALGEQGIVSSLCPRTSGGALLPETSDDFGYRPAVRTIVDRLKAALANQCLPQRLIPDSKGEVPCLILLTLTDTPGGEARCTADRGFSVPEASILQKFREQQAADFKNGGSKGPDPATFAVCQLNQLVVPSGGTCADNATDAGWCYVVNDAAGGQTAAGACSQAIVFTAGGQPTGAKISLQCIESSTRDGG